MVMMTRTCLLCLMVVAFASSAGAQSLVEIAKKEEARRKAVKAPSKVLTNDDLKRYGPPVPPPVTTPQQDGSPAGAVQQDPSQKPAGDQEPVKDETWWRKRIADARGTLDRNALLVQSLQTRADALLTDFTARDDPAQRAVLADERAKTLIELQRVNDEITAARKLIADIEEEARAAGVPPGWLR